jgi:hypothetical protein
MHYGPDETLRRNPLSYLKVIGPVMLLDSLGIYGPNVWVIFKDVCEQNHARMLAVLRATQLGMLSSEALLEVSNRQYRNEGKVKTIDVAELYFKVKDLTNNRADLHR